MRVLKVTAPAPVSFSSPDDFDSPDQAPSYLLLSSVLTTFSTSPTFLGSHFLNACWTRGECRPVPLAVLICPSAQDAHRDQPHARSHHSRHSHHKPQTHTGRGPGPSSLESRRNSRRSCGHLGELPARACCRGSSPVSLGRTKPTRALFLRRRTLCECDCTVQHLHPGRHSPVIAYTALHCCTAATWTGLHSWQLRRPRSHRRTHPRRTLRGLW